MRAALCLALLALSVSPPASAQWGGDRWGSDRWSRNASEDRSGDRREGQVSSAHFVADHGAEVLGQGTIQLVVMPDSTPEARDRLTYEAALIDRLVLAGYDTLVAPGTTGQRAELRVVRTIAEPAEQKRSPVSGETSVMVSNHGSAYGMALNFDFTEPRTALIATSVDLRIRDAASDAVLWEARATITTREGDDNWDEAAIANRLAAALLDEFPRALAR